MKSSEPSPETDGRSAGLTFAVITGLCWAILAIALRQALEYASSGTIVWFRMVVAFSCLFFALGIRRPKNLEILIAWPRVTIIAGLCLAANYFAYMKGVELTSASNAQIMIQIGPIMLICIGVLFFKEIPTRMQAIGIFTAIGGFSLFFWDQILLTLANADRYIEGNWWILFAALTWAVYAGLQKQSSTRFSAQQYNLLIYLICLFCLFPLAELSEMREWTWGVWILMVGLGINTLIAYGALAEALARVPASHVSLIVSCNPLLTLFLVTTLGSMQLSWIDFEPVGWRGWIGAALVIGGVALTVFRK